MKEREKITAIIPTFNEELNIEYAIKSVDFADEIIVIDSYSTDKTVVIANRHNIRLIERKFDDFSSQKNYAIDQAKNNWIYILDADERVSNDLRKEILEAVKKPTNFVGFYIYRTFYFLSQKINYGGWQRDKVIHLFKKDKCKYNGNLVHETITYNGEIGFLNHKIEHYSYRNYDHYLKKLNHYASLQAKELFIKKKSVNIFHIVLKPLYRFFVHYVIRLGFLDGFPGYVLAAQH
ncbi:MAG: glycosyltransferase [Flavobacteriaceae bacterium]|nr:glycosyltransferase [Flavobacteriaceae bacterium]